MAASQNTNPEINSSNPLFLNSSDNPNVVLVSKTFDGTGFTSWKRSMILALLAKNKLGFVNGDIVKPISTSPEFASWNRVNSMIISWLLNSLSKDIAESVLFLQTAKEIWDELHQRFEQSNGILTFQVQRQLYSLSQGSDEFAPYFTKLKKIWDELRMVQNLPNCSCGVTNEINRFLEEQRLHQLLMGLNDSYRPVRTQILMMNPLPSVSTAYSMIIQEEKQREIQPGSSSIHDSIAMHVSSSDSKKTLICNNCKKPGHTKANCYRIIGFPANFKFTKAKRDDSSSSSSSKQQHAVHNVVTNQDSSTISHEQYEHLVKLLTQNNLSVTDGAMLDSGPFIEE